MAAADNSQQQEQTPQTSSSTAVTSAPPAPPPAAPAKAQKKPLTPEEFNKLTDRLDVVLVALVLLFSFLTSCFAVRNSDFFQQLATGRLIAHGQYEFGKDPFVFTAENERWVNHSWLFSLGLYLLYGIGEAAGIVLIGLKALAMTALAAVMLLLSRKPGQRWLIPASCTAVAFLALSPRLLLQPVVVSYLFLALTLLIVRWPSLRAPAPAKTPSSYRCFWLLPPLFALWVNCDAWFFLGPITVALYWLGEYLQDSLSTERTPTRPAAELRILGYALLAGLAACLLNPHHVFAFTLPPQLGMTEAATAVRKDNQLQLLFVSPLDKLYWRPNIGLSAAGIAYFPLLAAGILSFSLSYKSLRYWRVLLFVPFALLSIYHARAIPFFAVVAGPITSLNFLDFAAAQTAGEIEPDRLRQRWAFGRAVALIAAVVLVVCSIPGWTQSQPFENRHFAWKIITDASLVKTCEDMAALRRDGLLKANARWFNVAPDAVNYMAWFCPGERGFLDLRLSLYDAATAQDYVDVHDDLLTVRDVKNDPAGQAALINLAATRKVFQKHKIDYVIVYSPEPRFLSLPLVRFLNNPAEWTPCHIDGHTLVFAWNKDGDAETRQHNEPLKLDLNALAFGPQALPSPRTRPARPAIRHEWYTALWEMPPQRQQEVDDARVYHLCNQFLLERWVETKRAEFARTARLAARAGGPLIGLFMDHPQAAQNYVLQQPPPAPAALYLSLRGLRRSFQANPDDPQAYLLLGQTYMSLFWNTQEWRMVSPRVGLPQIAQIRQTQVMWALNKALQLNPDLKEAHETLANWYHLCRERNVPCYLDQARAVPYVDLELKHRKEQLRLAKQELGATDTPGASEEPSPTQPGRATPDIQVKELEKEVQKLSADVQKLQDQYEINMAGKNNVIQRALAALDLGLGEEALEVLRKATPEDLIVTPTQGGPQYPIGAIIEMKLLLSMGQLEEVLGQDLLDPDHKDRWGVLPEFQVRGYDWFRLLVAAAAGDYNEVDDNLAAMQQAGLENDGKRNVLQLFDVVGQPTSKSVLPTSREAIALFAGYMLLNETPPLGGLPGRISRFATIQFQPRNLRREPLTWESVSSLARDLLSIEADYPAMRGWMALEAGDVVEARTQLREALAMALPRDRNLALYGALGPQVPADKARHREGALLGPGTLLPLRSTPLAVMGLRDLDSATERKR
jgi:hypothetical protein